MAGGVIFEWPTPTGWQRDTYLGVATLTGAVAIVIGAAVASRLARASRLQVRATYARDLAARLAICVDGLALVPCEGGPGIAPSR